MTEKPISFTVANFSEQIIYGVACHPVQMYDFYSAVMHCDGVVYQHKTALRPEFTPPMSALRSEAWLKLLEAIAERKP